MGVDMKNFVRDRDAAFTAFVMDDDWGAVRDYCVSYGVRMPEDPNVMAAGVYKAVQECTGIPDDVKVRAAMKCMGIGFNPFMRMAERGNENGR